MGLPANPWCLEHRMLCLPTMLAFLPSHPTTLTNKHLRTPNYTTQFVSQLHRLYYYPDHGIPTNIDPLSRNR
jgi:hypothetical protein